MLLLLNVQKYVRCLLHLLDDGLESLGIVHGEVSENLTVDFDTVLVQSTHQLGIAHTFQTSSGVDTLNPQSAEGALLIATVAIGVGETLLPSVLGYGPNVLASSKITFSELQDTCSLCLRGNVIY